MKKFINNPDNMTVELLQGLAAAYPQKIKLENKKLVCAINDKDSSKVAVVTLGGSGHEPALEGFVGEGLVDIAVVGDIFAAPGPPTVLEALKKMKRDAGILLVVLNHAGDVMSAQMAVQMAEAQGIKIKQILTTEEVRPDVTEEGRGLGGCLLVYKIAGAAAEQGKSLDEVYRIAEKMNKNMAAVAVLSEVATHPSTGGDCGEIGENEMEICAGQHGEGGGVRMGFKTANETAQILCNKILEKMKWKSGDEILLAVNGSGKTTLMEQLIVFNDAKNYLEKKGIKVIRGLANELLTVQEAGGFQLMAAKLDDELKELWDAPCDSPYFTVR